MVCTLKHFFPKVFDEYQRDEGFEGRSSSNVKQSVDTLATAEATDAPVSLCNERNGDDFYLILPYHFP